MEGFIEKIRKQVSQNNYKMSYHARINKGHRKIKDSEIIETILKGEVIEKNPNARPHPKCLFMLPIRGNQPLYVVCADTGQNARIITVHWHDPNKWIDWKTRRQY